MSDETVMQTRGPGRPRRSMADDVVTVTGVEAGANKPEGKAEIPSKRRRRSSVGGHALKLSAPQREGFTRRWVNDDRNRIAEAEELAYDFVTDGGIKSHTSDSRIARLVGTKEGGAPMYSYLMETPNELYAEGVAEKEAQNRQTDEAIAAGRDSTGQIPQGEGYGEGSIRRDR